MGSVTHLVEGEGRELLDADERRVSHAAGLTVLLTRHKANQKSR